MAESIEVSAVPVAATPPPATENNAEVRNGAENVGINQAINRMLKIEQAKEAGAKADSVPPAENATTTPPAEESATAALSETEAADPAQAEAPEAEADAALSHEDKSLDPKIQELVNKRIEKRVAKEVAKRKALESQLNELKLSVQAQATQTPAQPETFVPLPEGAPPLANVNDAKGLALVRDQAFQAKDEAERNLDMGIEEFQMDGQTYRWKEVIRNANKTLERHIPERAHFLQMRQQAQQAAIKEFPYLADKSSPDYVHAQSAYQAMPWLKNLPNGDWIIGVQIEGLKALQAKKEAAERKAATKTPVRQAPPPASQTAISSNGSVGRIAVGTRAQQEISAIRASQSRKGGVTANDAIAALTKIEQLKHQ